MPGYLGVVPDPPAPRGATHGGRWSQASLPLLRSPPGRLGFRKCSPNTLGLASLSARRCAELLPVQENGWAWPPVSPKFGHCPRAFQRAGRCPPDIASGVSLTLSSARRPPLSAWFCFGSQSARGRSLQPCGELPADSAPRSSVVLPACTGRCPAGAGARLGQPPPGRPARGAVAAALVPAGRPETGASFVCCLQRS